MLVVAWSVAILLLMRSVALASDAATSAPSKSHVVRLSTVATFATTVGDDDHDDRLRAEILALESSRAQLLRAEKDLIAQQKLLKASEIAQPFVGFGDALRRANVSLAQLEA